MPVLHEVPMSWLVVTETCADVSGVGGWVIGLTGKKKGRSRKEAGAPDDWMVAS